MQSKEFNSEEFLSAVRQETEKVLQVLSKLHQKVLTIESRVERCERHIDDLEKQAKSSIIIH